MAGTELKPCPFCGGEARHYAPEPPDHHIECRNCCADMGGYETEAEAIKAWNTRYERTCHIVKASRKYVLSDGTELFEDGCSECNEYLAEDDNYCPNCGAKVIA